MRKHFLIAASAAAVLLASIGFAPAASASPVFDIQKIEQAAATDLAAAKADADAHGDKFASQCYAGIAAYVAQNPVSASVPNIQGVASAFQAGRDVVKGVQGAAGVGALPPDLIAACGPLALDVQNDLGKAAASGVSIFGFKF